MFLRFAAVIAALLMSVLSPVTSTALAQGRANCDWTQWGQDAAHTGQSCVPGQRDLQLLASTVVDPFAAQEAAESPNGSYISVHYPAPLVDGDGNVFVLRKGGTYVSCDPPGSGQPAPCGNTLGNIQRETWSVQAMHWQHNQLVPTWTFTSDWKPSALFGKESLFQSALSQNFLYVPGAGGTVFQLDKHTGRVVARLNPFGAAVDPAAFASGGLTLDSRGDLFYNVVRSEPLPNGQTDGHGWLVRVTPDRRISLVDYRTLIPGAPQPTDLCYGVFNAATTARPFPPPPQADGSPTLPAQQLCGSQRAALSEAPAVSADGTVFTVTRASANSSGGGNYGYVVALNPNLTLKWATSLRGILDDGCGVLAPYSTDPTDTSACRPGTALGVDPYTDLPPAANVDDGSTASPVALPDGGVVFGTRNLYNDSRGHLMKFDRNGHYVANYDYGWDITPAVYAHDGTYSLYIKDQHYDTNGPYYLTKLDADLAVEWSHPDTETQTCQRNPDGTISCVDTGLHPNGFEWCISAPAVDRNGTVYGLNQDGNLYAIDSQGHQVAKVFLGKTIAAAYTPVSLDAQGRVYAQNNGQLYVLGSG